MAGESPNPDPDALRLRDAINYFLCDREQRVESGEITQRIYDDYVKECKNVVKVLGAQRVVLELTAQDFNFLKSTPPNGSPNTLGNHIARVRIAFKYLYDAGLIDKPVRVGPSFKRPSTKSIRLHRAKQPKKLFKAADLRLLVAEAKPQLANQYVGQITPTVRQALFGNVGTLIVFRLGVDDAKLIASRIRSFQ